MSTWKNKIKIPGHIPGWAAGVLTGILFLAAGAVHGEFTVIFRKAVMICLECIGIG